MIPRGATHLRLLGNKKTRHETGNLLQPTYLCEYEVPVSVLDGFPISSAQITVASPVRTT